MGFNPLKAFKKKEKDVVIDLSTIHRTPKSTQEPTSTSQEQEGIGFLGNLASASTDSSNSPTSENVNDDRFRSNAINPERFERFGRRIDRVLARMELLERKIERIEHRLDIGSSSR